MCWIGPITDDDHNTYEQFIDLGNGYELRLEMWVSHIPTEKVACGVMLVHGNTVVERTHLEPLTRETALAMVVGAEPV